MKGELCFPVGLHVWGNGSLFIYWGRYKHFLSHQECQLTPLVSVPTHGNSCVRSATPAIFTHPVCSRYECLHQQLLAHGTLAHGTDLTCMELFDALLADDRHCLLCSPSLWVIPEFCLKQSLFFGQSFFTCRCLQIPMFCLCIFIQQFPFDLKLPENCYYFCMLVAMLLIFQCFCGIVSVFFSVFAMEHSWQL